MEIRTNSYEGEQPCNRPDIVARDRDIKFQYLLHIIAKESLFGEILAYVCGIEFQKRGLRHLHFHNIQTKL